MNTKPGRPPARTLEMYNASTYSLTEILYESMLGVGVNVTEIATLYYGRCVLVEPPNEASDYYRTDLYMSTKEQIVLHFVDKGQELCIIYGNCDSFISTATLSNNGAILSKVRIKVKKKIHLALSLPSYLSNEGQIQGE